jgi:hypothetical protein
MTQYAATVSFTFYGIFYLNAESKEQARDYVDECGLTRAGGIYTPEAADVGWDFPVHPSKTIERITVVKRRKNHE